MQIIHRDLGLSSSDVTIHQSGAATVFVSDDSDEDSDEEG
jgi:hypothetical protein